MTPDKRERLMDERTEAEVGLAEADRAVANAESELDAAQDEFDEAINRQRNIRRKIREIDSRLPEMKYG